MTATETRAGSASDHFQLLARLRATFAAGTTRPLEWRYEQLRGLRRLLTEREPELLAALQQDLGKPGIEGWVTELGQVRSEIDHILKHLAGWAAPQRVPVRAVLWPSRASVVTEPLGVALVVAPWNYPVSLLVLPMAHALAAGNAVVGKPSEVSAATSAALARWLPQFVDSEAVAVVEGDASVVTSLLEQRFDHFFFTGSARVGRIVMAAAAKHLTPVTLELGGKSPVIVDRSANVDVAARRVAWGKWLNAGQTCIAPDYVLVDREVERDFVEALTKHVRAFYGEDPRTSPDYARIINDSHFDRVCALVDGRREAQVAFGGDRDRLSRYLAPTVLTGVSWDEPAMAEEIFGPVLPVLGVDGLDEAIAIVNTHDKPLALYVFAEDHAAADRVVAETSSGGVGVNATLLQFTIPGLPFGGVGESGMGAYHGETGFQTFSHRKSLLIRPTGFDLPITYPPYTRIKQWILRRAV